MLKRLIMLVCFLVTWNEYMILREGEYVLKPQIRLERKYHISSTKKAALAFVKKEIPGNSSDVEIYKVSRLKFSALCQKCE